MKLTTRLLLAIAVCMSCIGTIKGETYTRYRIIGKKDGLSSNKTQDILRDSLGTCWVGTAKGLDRIYEDQVFSYDSDPKICNMNIRFITQDSRRNIWLAAHGLFIYDYMTDSFNEVKADDSMAIYPNWYGETDKGVWFCSDKGISLYSHDSGKMKMLIPRKWEDTRYNGFCITSDSTSFASTTDGVIYRIDLKTTVREEIYRFPHDIYVKAVLADPHGKVWLAVYGKGLFCFSMEDGRLEKVFPHGGSFFGKSIILDIQHHDGSLYVATDGEGIFKLDPISFKAWRLDSLPKELSSVNKLYISDGELWIGTIRHGVALHCSDRIKTLSGEHFGSYKDNGANRSVINSLSEDCTGNIWIGTDGGGLHVYHPKTGELDEIREFKGEKVVAAECINDRQMLISVYSKGLFRYDTKTGRTSYVPIIDNKVNGEILAQDIIVSLKKTPDGRILILARSLYIYDPQSGKVRESDIRLTGTNNLKVIHIDSLFSYAHTHYEVFRIDHRTDKAERIYHTDKGDISCMRMTGDSICMIQSYSLATLDPVTKRSRVIPFHYNGRLLPVMETDDEGNIYLASKEDIIRIRKGNPEDYTKFPVADGVRFNDFIEDVSLSASSGHIYFGGNSGFCMMDSMEAEPDALPQTIHLLRANVNGANVSYRISKEGHPIIDIPWNYESMYFDISTEGDEVFRKNKFRYTINDSDKQTVILSDSRLSLPTLSPGRYDIDIAYADCSDRWTESGCTITVTVTPPWWKNMIIAWGTMLVLALLTFTGIFIYHRMEKVKSARKYQKRKEKLSENKLQFLTNLSHELKTPLTLIYSPLKRLLDNNEFEHDTAKELKGILSQSQYMNQLINMVLDSRKLEEGFGVLNIGQYDLASWIREVCEEFRQEFEYKSIRLDCMTDGGEQTLNFDESKFRIILSNLLMNSWKYSDADTCVTVKVTKEAGMTRIAVIDQGIGISDADNIFNRFIQGNRQTKGFGLGLSYTKLLVEAHPGGRIGAYANPDKGSTFWFEIPDDLPCGREKHIEVSEIAAGDDEMIRVEAEEADINTSSVSLLIAEDERELLNFLKRNLSPLFKEVYTAADGKEALDIAGKKMPDIIISDVMMPQMNGYELCSAIKNNLQISTIPVILLTALSEDRHREQGYKSGADIYLTKPFDIPVLLAAIRNLLHKRSMIKERYGALNDNLSAMEGTFSNADEQFILKLNEFVDGHLSDEHLDAQIIIDHFCMGRASFYKKIKDVTGLGIMEYVTKRRMATAAGLLSKTRLPISEIAVRTGYSNNQYFNKVFRKHFNMSPSSYRNQSSPEDVT